MTTLAPLPKRISSDSAFAARRSGYRLARQYYGGRHRINNFRAPWEQGVRKIRNFLGLFVDTTVSQLGEPSVSWEDGEGPHDAHYRETMEREGGAAFETALELGLAVDGDGITKVTWDASRGVRVVDVDPSAVYVERDAADPSTVALVAQQYEIAEGRTSPALPAGIGAAFGPRGKTTITEVWTRDRWEIWRGEELSYAEENPYGGLIPYVVAANVRLAREWWGVSDVLPLVGLQDAINTGEHDLDWTMELAGNVVVRTGVDDSKALAVRPGVVWDLPEKATASVLDLLTGNAVGQRLDYLSHLRDVAHSLSRVPHVSVGDAGIGSTVSGLALQLQLGPLERLIATKRVSRTAALRERARLVASLGSQFGGLPEIDGLPDVSWRDAIPSDRQGDLANSETELRLGRDAEAVLADIGVEDPRAELEARRRQVSEGLIGPAGSMGDFGHGRGSAEPSGSA